MLHTAAATFEAARRLSGVPADHPARRPHGHGFTATLQAQLPEHWAPYAGGEIDALRAALAAAVAPLDYRMLNDVVDDPSDDNVARWLLARLDLPGLERLGVQSTQQRGVDLDRGGRSQLWRRYALQAAHRLPNVPPAHKCARLHGHGFEVILRAGDGPVDARFGTGYDELDAIWAPLHAELDHRCLNDVPGLDNPTSEVLASWLWARIEPLLPRLASVTVYETGQSGAIFDGRRYGIWKDLHFDSASRLPQAPPGDPRRRLHGHTYTLRLHLSAPLDALRGWTVDFGEVRTAFEPVFDRIDHRPLHELAGLDRADAASLARWLRRETLPALPQLDRIDVYETRGCGAVLRWSGRDVALPP